MGLPVVAPDTSKSAILTTTLSWSSEERTRKLGLHIPSKIPTEGDFKRNKKIEQGRRECKEKGTIVADSGTGIGPSDYKSTRTNVPFHVAMNNAR